ncbi:carboxypeptidase-like regulatory domain-containing protein [Sphingobacterium oryzagri]|uniref:Carboxypeptidase-like regulatory domain-containing protein n=1 Tax=Sphingobacterium oryzagri TaxID=3025669 RepID=A0ABY7WG58_9SPHI|nr:carboxypeptidase-like regulatory domain-containing protein [Sphingobacterium sp. KACC 22765]WDF68629.1 carboxypeptidase-like regulatory domain-containing protein [Sphingobacterium sp. KACC 22765]
MLRFLLSLLCFCCCAFVSAQQQLVSGKLIDKQSGLPIAAASITIKSSAGKIVAFKATDAKGLFQISIVAEQTDYNLEINHLGYKKYALPLRDATDNLTIALEPQAILLEDVEVKSKPMIRRIGDTLAYDVGSFAREEDRSIGDVLKRLPGIEVSDAGQIKYQGKEISNFYIDGDDLLSDRYALGTRTIPHKMVKDIQVLNNHEHLKVLKNKRFTDQVAINLVIKEDAKLKMTGEAKIGVGLPKQYDSELNNMLFNKKYKMLNVLNGNNVGNDLSNELIGYNRENTLARLGTMPINNLLSLGTVENPPLAKQHYFINNSGSLNTNNLFNLGNHWQLKSNIQAVYNQSTQQFNGQTDFFTNEEVISFTESQAMETKEFLAAIRLSANQNLDKKYISNAFSFEYEKEDALANIRSNGQAIAVGKQHQIRGFSNQLDYVPELANKNILQINWFVNYGSKPQALSLSPGVFPAVFNNNLPYQTTEQVVDVPNFYSKLSSGYRVPKGKINQYYGVSVSLEDQRLRSNIALLDSGMQQAPLLDSTSNAMHWLRSLYSIHTEYSWKKNRLEMALSLPLSFQRTTFSDPTYLLHEAQNKWLFLPSFRLKYRAWREDDLDFSYNFTNNFGNIQDVYRGIIIRNYRSLSQNTADINESSMHAFSLNYRFNRTVKMLFSNIGLSYSKTQREAILAQQISNNISQTILSPIPNDVHAYALQMGIDKYIFPLAGTLKLNASMTYTTFEQLFNDVMLPFQGMTYMLRPQMEIKIWRMLNLSYSSTLEWSNARQRNQPELGNSVFNLAQNISLPLSIFKGAYIRLTGRHLHTRQPAMQDFNYFFADASARYRVAKWKTDVELNLTNLANIKTFQTYTISSNQQSQNNYALRGRMAVLKVVFAL